MAPPKKTRRLPYGWHRTLEDFSANQSDVFFQKWIGDIKLGQPKTDVLTGPGVAKWSVSNSLTYELWKKVYPLKRFLEEK